MLTFRIRWEYAPENMDPPPRSKLHINKGIVILYRFDQLNTFFRVL